MQVPKAYSVLTYPLPSTALHSAPQDTWETYRKCEHATALYIRAFKPKAAGCSTLAAKGPCATMAGVTKAGH
jgi:hypothetical protein